MRLVLDTNVWLDWLVFDEPAVAPLKAAVAAGRAAVFIDAGVEAELARVLAYPFGSRSLGAQAQADALAQCARIAHREDVESRKAEACLPACSDPDDQKFLELALACGADYLVTRDAALLELAGHVTRPLPYGVVTPAQLAAVLDGTAV